MKIYKSSWIGSVFLYIVVSVILCYVTSYLFKEYILYFAFNDHDFILYIINGIELVLLFVFFKHWIISIEVDEESVRFKRGKRVYQRFRFSSYIFQPNVDRHIDIIILANRSLICRNARGVKYMMCHHFSKQTFSRMISQIFAIQNEIAEQYDIFERRESYKAYHIPSERINRSPRKNPFLLVSTLMLLVFTITGIMGYLRGQANGPIAFSPSIAFGLLTLFFLQKEYRIRSRTPRTVQIYPNRLRIDDTFYDFSQIKKIIATTATQAGDLRINRMWTVYLNNKPTERYHFGVQTPIKKLSATFSDYEELCGALQKTLGTKFEYSL